MHLSILYGTVFFYKCFNINIYFKCKKNALMYFTSVKQKRTYPFYMVQFVFIYVLILIYITSIKQTHLYRVARSYNMAYCKKNEIIYYYILYFIYRIIRICNRPLIGIKYRMLSSESELAPNSRTRRKIKTKPLNNNQLVVVLQLLLLLLILALSNQPRKKIMILCMEG